MKRKDVRWIYKLSILGVILMTIGNIRILFFEQHIGDEGRLKRGFFITVFLLVVIFVLKKNGYDKEN